MTLSAGSWLAAAREVLDRIETTQMDAIGKAAEMSADTISAGEDEMAGHEPALEAAAQQVDLHFARYGWTMQDHR